MFGLVNLTRVQRLILGVFVLLLVDIIWVASSELTKYLYSKEDYNKPYFSTYLKTSMFILYLFGFLFFKPWRQQCRRDTKIAVDANTTDSQLSADKLLSDPIYVPIKYDDKNSGTDSDDALGSLKQSRSVRFSNLSEVRHLSESQAEEAALARLSYTASVRAEQDRIRAMNKLNVKQVAKLSMLFCLLWFFGNLAYQEALNKTTPAIVNVLSSTSSLFTLVLAAIFPSAGTDKFTLSKLVAVLLSIGGMVLISINDAKEEQSILPLGALWALCGALLYAMYLVMLKRKVDNEEKLDIPMFFGFVGLFNIIFLWPGFFILHYTKQEEFQPPNKTQWIILAINGLIGTVLSELLWLWGCFLTSSLQATLSLSLAIPMTMLVDVIMKNDNGYDWMFYVGSVPVFLSFFAVAFLSHYENWDPVLLGIKKLVHCICRRRPVFRLRDLDREQTESLIGINTSNDHES